MRTQRGTLGCLLLSLVGLGLSTYLSLVHLALLRGEFFGGAACGAAGSLFNCHAVTASPFGSLFGIPLALWGLLGYLAVGSLALIAWQFPDWTLSALTSIVALGLLFLAIDAGLLVLMATKIKVWCLFCLLTYLVNLLLVLVAKSASGESWRVILGQMASRVGTLLPPPRHAAAWMLWGMLIVGASGAWAVNQTAIFMTQGPTGTLRKQMADHVRHQSRVQVDLGGDPTLGAAHPKIQLVEFSDFLCPVCQRAAKFNTIIVAGRRDELSFTFKHFPLDQSCNETIKRAVHPNACQLAAATECAHAQGKFWALHDLIFEKGHFYQVADLDRDAGRIGLDLAAFRDCMASGRGMEAVKRDIAQAAGLGVNSTPTYIINGVVVTGALTPAVFEEMLRAIRQRDAP